MQGVEQGTSIGAQAKIPLSLACNNSHLFPRCFQNYGLLVIAYYNGNLKCPSMVTTLQRVPITVFATEYYIETVAFTLNNDEEGTHDDGRDARDTPA
jgi:hypothetical protein